MQQNRTVSRLSHETKNKRSKNKLVSCMKKCLKLMFLMLLTAGFVSCLKTDNDYPQFGEGFGIITAVGDNNYFEIYTDLGNTLKAVESYVPSDEVSEGKRVMFNCQMLSDQQMVNGRPTYDVCMNYFYNLLTKPLISESFIQESPEIRPDSVGNDPIKVDFAEFGGDYINIRFLIYVKRGSDTKHLINLVWDDTANDGKTYLTLRHNAYGELPYERYDDAEYELGVGICSFKLSDLIPEGSESLDVVLKWTWYDGQTTDTKEYSDSGTFRPYNGIRIGNGSGTESQSVARTLFLK